MKPSLTQWIITMAIILSGLSLGSTVQAAATAGPADLAASSVPAASDQILPWKIFLPAILSNSDGSVKVPVGFTFTFAAGQYNTLPAGADRVQVAVAGAESISKELLRSNLPDPKGAGQLTFYLPPGQYTYTSQALQGSLPAGSVLSTIGPILMTVSPNFPLSIPMIAAFATFDNYQTDIGGSGPNSQIFFGTEDRDRFVQYGGNADDTQYIEGGAANDWFEQFGGGGNDGLVAESGTGNDYIYQDGGSGNDMIKSAAGFGDDYIIQVGGSGDNELEVLGGDGNDEIRIVGGDGNDSIYAKPDSGNDLISIDAGPGDDKITYEVASGTDTAFIDGGKGADTLEIKENGMSFTLESDLGQILYQTGTGGTVITVKNIEHITVLDPMANILFQWNAPYAGEGGEAKMNNSLNGGLMPGTNRVINKNLIII